MTTDNSAPERPDPRDTGPLTADERAELERLRAASTVRTHRFRHALRWTTVGILLTLMGVAVFGSVVARFCRSEILDTDRYVATMAPLGSDPAVHAELADRITTAILTRVDIEEVTAKALTALTDNLPQAADRPRVTDALRSLPPLVAAQAAALIHQTALSLVSSDQFEQLWVAANRRAHQTLVAALTGRQGPAIEVDDQGTVSISLQGVLTIVRQKLDEHGITFGDRLPDVDAQFVLFRSADLIKAQRAVRMLDRLANVLPWIALAAATGAVWLTPRKHRTRALALAGSSAALAMVVLAIALVIGRRVYLDAMPPEVLSADAAAALIDAVYAPLRAGLRAVLALGLIVAVASYLAGQSLSARAVRSGGARALAAVRSPRRGEPHAVETFAARYRVPLRWGIVAVAALTVAFWRFPTGLVVLGIAVITGVLLLAVELLARPSPKSETSQRQGEFT
ncbi:hypothetical protein ABZ942_01705 [Nocardia sp. NPDC046473]|uniref:hypothetical protein n=1 Tax=Nocardia sp. NPDC046473 TaxID=3155733 RepID=UPI00340DF6CB